MSTLSYIFESAAHSGVRKAGKLIKIESTKRYIEGVQVLRTLWMSLATIQIFLFLLALSTLTFIATVIILLPLETDAKLLIGAVLSGLIMIASLATVVKLNSESMWLKYTKANDLIRSVLEHDTRL